MNVVKFQIKIDTISMTIFFFYYLMKDPKLFLKFWGTDKMVFLQMQHEMLVHFTGFFQ